jgi:hypothetical protein
MKAMNKLSNIFSKNKSTISNRRHIRYDCYAIGTIFFLNRSISLEGVISEISKSGLKFRPAKTYLLERKQSQVLCEFGNFRISGRIVAARPDGYGIALLEALDEDKLSDFLEKYSKQ